MKQQLEEFIEAVHGSGIYYREAVNEFKKRYVVHVLTLCRGNQSKAAIDMNMHRNTLARECRTLGIKAADYRQPRWQRKPALSVSVTAQRLKVVS